MTSGLPSSHGKTGAASYASAMRCLSILHLPVVDKLVPVCLVTGDVGCFVLSLEFGRAVWTLCSVVSHVLPLFWVRHTGHLGVPEGVSAYAEA